MNERLQLFILYKTGGVQKDFCSLLGWSPQYLAKLLKGINFGIVPVVSIVERFPELNARWLLTGVGEMLSDSCYNSFHSAVRSHVEHVFELERFVPVMSPSELHDFEDLLYGRSKKYPFSENQIEMLELRLSKRTESVSVRVREARAKSDELCKMKEVKE